MAKTIYECINSPIKKAIQVPGDKSISHRAVMFGAISEGETVIDGFLLGDDCLHTISCFRSLGVSIEIQGSEILIDGKGFNGLKEPLTVLDVGNSGTTIRLMLGILAGRPFYSVLSGDKSLNRRPMGRVVNPLRQLGVSIHGRHNGQFAPLSLQGGDLQSFEYKTSVASAQVKSALLFAGLQAKGKSTITEPALTRDHTERMMKAFGGVIETNGTSHSVEGLQTLKGSRISVPGDISSAAFFIVLALLVPESELIIEKVGINPTRDGVVKALRMMGANIDFVNQRMFHYEPVADILVKSSDLHAITIDHTLIPSLIDEIPIIALLATRAKGKTVIKDASELKVKETNRIDTVVNELKKLGANIEATDDGMIIEGDHNLTLRGGEVSSHGDHRIGMMLAIASSISSQPVVLEDSEAISVSFPTFNETFNKVKQS